MRQLTAWLFCTLDGVVDSPEQWVLYNDQIDDIVHAAAASADTLLLGRTTYEVFAASWPERTVEDDSMAPWMNDTPKVVVSTSLRDPAWKPTTVISDMGAVRHLKDEPGKDILVNGSSTLVRSLLGADLLDTLTLFVHPTVVGNGAQLFPAGASPRLDLRLMEATPLANGVLAASYARSDGTN